MLAGVRAVLRMVLAGSGASVGLLRLLRLDGGDSAPMLTLHIEVRYHRAAVLPEHLLKIDPAVLAGNHLHRQRTRP